MSTAHQQRRVPIRRRWLTLTAAASALVLAVPATAGAWPQAGADAAGTHQATSSGPSDPGLKWISQLEDLPPTGDAPEGFAISHDKPLVIGAEGTIMLHAGAIGQSVGEGNRHLLGIDPDDGSLAWNRAYQETSCVPAVDSQDRGWALEQDRDPGGFTGVGEDMLVAFDTATGETIPGATLLPVSTTESDDLNWCRSIALHIGGAGNLERAILFDGRPLLNETDSRHGILAIDISGEAASEAWVLDPEAADAPFGEVVRDSSEERIAAFTDDSLLVTTRTAGQLELVELSLADGSVTNRVDLPAYNDDLSTASNSNAATSATVLVDGDTAVVAVSTDSDGRGALHGVALNGSWDQPSWSEPFDDNPSAQRGPRSLALSGGNVISASGAAVDNLYARNTATGAATSWSGNRDRVRGSGAVAGQYITDASGTIYVTDYLPGSSFRLDKAYSAYSAAGALQWRFTRAQLLQETGLSDNVDGLNNDFNLRAIDDGVLYLHTEEQLIAIDNSGGLAELAPRFSDVPPGSTHAENIDRLVGLGITQGTTDTTYGPGQPVTRAQFATFLVRSLGEEAFPSETFNEAESYALDTFGDVRPGVHTANIGAVALAGITTGVTADTFEPNSPLPRAQMASLLVRAFELGEGQEFPSDIFIDVDQGNVHAPNIEVVAGLGITSGTTATTFAPDRTVDRAQMASFLIRTLDTLED